MRILFLAQRVPFPPNRGDKIPTFHYIRHLAKSHDVVVACLADGPPDLANVAGLEPMVAAVDAVPRSRTRSCFRAVAALASDRPLTVAYFDEPDLRRRVKAQLTTGDFDAVVVFSSGMASFVEEFTDVPRIIQFADLDSQKWQQYADATWPPRRWVYRAEARRLLDYERHIAKTFSYALVCSERELHEFHRLIPNVPVQCIRNGVDLDYYRPSSATKDPANLVFTGVMNYFPNVDGVMWFAREVLPLIQQEISGVTFTICGSAPDRRVRALRAVPGVTVTGTVPDVRTYLSQASVAVIPVRIARGVQNKLLEAMAMGLPTVATTAAWSGVEAMNGRDLLVADEPAAFADAVVRLLRDSALREQIGQAARAAVEANYRWDQALAQLDEVIAAVVGNRLDKPVPSPPRVLV